MNIGNICYICWLKLHFKQRIMKTIVTLIILLVIGTAVAQTKVGTVDPELIITKMSELASVQDGIKAYNEELQVELQKKLDAYDVLIKAYQASEAGLSDDVKKTKQQEIIEAEQDIQKFQNNGNQLIQIKQDELLKPLYTKIGEALNEIASAEGYTQVLTTGGGTTLAYADPNFDLTVKVMQKLGLKLE